MECSQRPQLGYRVEGEVLSAKGTCSCGHKQGDRFNLSAHDPAGLCGFFYHDVFPYIVMLQFGGGFPPEWGDPDVLEFECMDKLNTVRMRLRRVR